MMSEKNKTDTDETNLEELVGMEKGDKVLHVTRNGLIEGLTISEVTENYKGDVICLVAEYGESYIYPNDLYTKETIMTITGWEEEQ